MHDDLGIGIRSKGDAFALQFLPKGQEVFHDAVVHHRDGAFGIDVRMGVAVHGLTVGGPAGVRDAHVPFQRRAGHLLFQDPNLPGLATDFNAAVAQHRHAGGIVPPVLQTLQPVDEDGHSRTLPDIADNPTHKATSLRLPVSGIDAHRWMRPFPRRAPTTDFKRRTKWTSFGHVRALSAPVTRAAFGAGLARGPSPWEGSGTWPYAPEGIRRSLDFPRRKAERGLSAGLAPALAGEPSTSSPARTERPSRPRGLALLPSPFRKRGKSSRICRSSPPYAEGCEDISKSPEDLLQRGGFPFPRFSIFYRVLLELDTPSKRAPSLPQAG